MKDDRRITIAFTDGTDMQFGFPKQIDDPSQIATMLRKALSENQLVLAVEGAMYTIPYNNVKYIRVSPCPAKLPDTAILGVKLAE
jgi:hypothetical protein